NIVQYFVSFRTIKVKVDVPCLVRAIKIKPAEKFRLGTSDVRSVLVIYFAVAIDICKVTIAGCSNCARAIDATRSSSIQVINLFLRLINADRLVTVKFSDGTSNIRACII